MQNPDLCPNAQALPEPPRKSGKINWWAIILNVALTSDCPGIIDYWIYDRDIFI